MKVTKQQMLRPLPEFILSLRCSLIPRLWSVLVCSLNRTSLFCSRVRDVLSRTLKGEDGAHSCDSALRIRLKIKSGHWALLTYFYRTILYCFLPITLTACTAFAPVKPEIPVNYTLSSLPLAPLTKAQKSKIVILVTAPQTSQIYNTTRMVYVDKPYQINYFVKNRWADTPPQMLQQLIMQTLQGTQYYRAVIIPPAVTHYDFMLRTELLDLHQDFIQHPSQIYLTVRAQIINAASNQVTATQQFNIVETAPQDNPYGGVVAANQAVIKLMNGLAIFCNSVLLKA